MAPFHTNSKGRVTFSGEGYLAGGSGWVLLGDVEVDTMEALLCARHCAQRTCGDHLTESSQPPYRKVYCHPQFTDEETEAQGGHCLIQGQVGGGWWSTNMNPAWPDYGVMAQSGSLCQESMLFGVFIIGHQIQKNV